jgi:hypothetical protein
MLPSRYLDINHQDHVGESPSGPVRLTRRQEDLCRRLDDLHTRSGLDAKVKAKLSDMFRGAVFVSQTNLRNNPDWIAQAANSLREIFYHFHEKNGVTKDEAFRKYGSVHGWKKGFFKKIADDVDNDLHELAHHGNGRNKNIDITNYTSSRFEKLLEDFEQVLAKLLTRSVDVHNEIDDILESGPDAIVSKDIMP